MMIRHRSATALALVAAACTWPTPLYANQNQTNFEQEIDAVCEEIFQNEDVVCFTRSEPASTSTEQITPDEQPALYTSLVQISHNQINSIKHHVTGQRRQSLSGAHTAMESLASGRSVWICHRLNYRTDFHPR